MSFPTVSVLTSVYNGERYLRRAIDSILNQSFINFEYIIIDDGSTDSTNKIIQSFNDPRIKLIENTQNIGLTKSLNIGVKICRGDYIARIDADDISFKQRLRKQYHFLLNNMNVVLVGGQRIIKDYIHKCVWYDNLPL